MLKGIDVCTFQGTIEWRVAKLGGVDFAMIKASQGRGETSATEHLPAFGDSRFEYNLEHAHAAGIKCGVYHYFTARNVDEVDREAEFFIDRIRPYRGKIDLWAAVDVESEIHLEGLDRHTLTALVKRFMRKVKAAGFKPMLYANPNFLLYRYEKNAFAAEDIWLAQWGVSEPYKGINPKIWQYGKGRTSGVKTEVDFNYGYFDLPEAEPQKYAVGDSYTLKSGDVYSNGRAVPARLVGETYTISQVKDDRILLREIVSWVKV